MPAWRAMPSGPSRPLPEEKTPREAPVRGSNCWMLSARRAETYMTSAEAAEQARAAARGRRWGSFMVDSCWTCAGTVFVRGHGLMEERRRGWESAAAGWRWRLDVRGSRGGLGAGGW